MGSHLAVIALILARFRPGRIEFDGSFQFGDRSGLVLWDLNDYRTGVVMLAGTRKSELAAHGKEVVVVLALPCVPGGVDRAPRRGEVAEACRRPALHQM